MSLDTPEVMAANYLSSLIAKAAERVVLIPVSALKKELKISRGNGAFWTKVAKLTTNKFAASTQHYDWEVAYLPECSCFAAVSKSYAMRL